MAFAGELFPNEPEGAEAAIFWHLQQIDFHDNQATEADACDCVEAMDHHDNLGKRHQTRLKWLEDLFPLAAKDARASLRRVYDEHSKNISIKHPEEPEKVSDAILFYLDRIEKLQHVIKLNNNYEQHCLKEHQDRLEQLETEFPTASVAARMTWRQRQEYSSVVVADFNENMKILIKDIRVFEMRMEPLRITEIDIDRLINLLDVVQETKYHSPLEDFYE